MALRYDGDNGSYHRNARGELEGKELTIQQKMQQPGDRFVRAAQAKGFCTQPKAIGYLLDFGAPLGFHSAEARVPEQIYSIFRFDKVGDQRIVLPTLQAKRERIAFLRSDRVQGVDPIMVIR